MMTNDEMTEILEVLAAANPKTIFMELAFMESWVHAVNKANDGEGVPGEMLERSLTFLRREFNFVPRPVPAPTGRLAWAGRIAISLVALAGLWRQVALG